MRPSRAWRYALYVVSAGSFGLFVVASIAGRDPNSETVLIMGIGVGVLFFAVRYLGERPGTMQYIAERQRVEVANSFSGPLIESAVGGLRLAHGGNATWPLIRLDVCENGVRLGPSSRFLRPIVPTYWFSWSDLEGVDEVTGLGCQGLEFTPAREVPAVRRATFWPRVADRPCFWIRSKDMPRIEHAFPASMPVTHSRKWRVLT